MHSSDFTEKYTSVLPNVHTVSWLCALITRKSIVRIIDEELPWFRLQSDFFPCLGSAARPSSLDLVSPRQAQVEVTGEIERDIHLLRSFDKYRKESNVHHSKLSCIRPPFNSKR